MSRIAFVTWNGGGNLGSALAKLRPVGDGADPGDLFDARRRPDLAWSAVGGAEPDDLDE
jgi:hypothetical protein